MEAEAQQASGCQGPQGQLPQEEKRQRSPQEVTSMAMARLCGFLIFASVLVTQVSAELLASVLRRSLQKLRVELPRVHSLAEGPTKNHFNVFCLARELLACL